MKAMDKNGDGVIDAMGMGLDDLKRAVYDKLGSGEEAMKAMDKNGDGVIDEEEFLDEMKKAGFGEEEAKDMYKDLAGDDGKLTLDDFAEATGQKEMEEMAEEAGVTDEKEAMKGVPLPPTFAEADANGDGEVTKDEYIKAATDAGMSPEEAEASWKEVDADGDGKVTSEEIAAARDKAKDAAADFAAADTDGDGMLSEEEFLAAAREKGIPDDEAVDMFKKLDKDGDGQISGSEFTHGGGFEGSAAKGADTPPPVEVEAVPMDEVGRRMKAAFGTTGEAWEDLAGSPDENHMTEEQFLAKADQLGMTPEEAKAAFKAMDTDGDGKVSFDEFQVAMGVSAEDCKRRLLKKYGNAEKALAAADTDGDGNVSEEEFLAMAKELGIPESEAKKLFGELEKANGGHLTGEEFMDHFGATASDLEERLAEKFESPSDAFAKFDKNGDGEVSEEEFIEGAKEMGISESAAKKMFDKANADGKGGLSEDEFLTAFGAGPEELREACFSFMRDPKFAYHSMDTNNDGLLSPDEWKAGLAQMEFTDGQADRLFRLADTNDGENTQGFISRYEFWTFLAYRPHRPHFKYHWNTYYGDLDRWGYSHQKHNKLEHATAFLARLQ